MPLYRTLALVCLSLLPALSQQTPPPAAATPEANTEKPKKASASGKAINAKTGEPVKKAKLILINRNGSGSMTSAETDQAGLFEFKDLDAGSYNMIAERQGYVRQMYGAKRNPLVGATLTIKTGQELKDLQFSMWPQSVIAGKILDEDGDPVNMVAVAAIRYAYVKGKRQMVPVGMAMTNDAGEYRIASIGPGKYMVCANSRNIGLGMVAANDKSDKPQTGYAMTCYPNATDVAAAAQVNVTAGSEIPAVNLQLTKMPAVRVSGTVAGTDDNKQLILILMPKASGILGAAMGKVAMAQNGKFSIPGVTPGSYTLAAVNGQELTSRQTIEVGQDNVDNVTLTLGGSDVQGKLIAEGDGPAPKLSGIRVSLTAVDVPLSNPNANSGDDAAFTIKNVASDRYEVNVGEIPASYYVKAVKLGGREAAENVIDVSQGSTPSIEVVLSPKGASVDGVVADKNSKPMAGITVALVPKSRLNYLYRNATTDQSGRFEFKNLVPGDYEAYAWEDIELGAFQDPETLKQYESKATKLELKESAHQTLQLSAIPAEGAVEELKSSAATK